MSRPPLPRWGVFKQGITFPLNIDLGQMVFIFSCILNKTARLCKPTEMWKLLQRKFINKINWTPAQTLTHSLKQRRSFMRKRLTLKRSLVQGLMSSWSRSKKQALMIMILEVACETYYMLISCYLPELPIVMICCAFPSYVWSNL